MKKIIDALFKIRDLKIFSEKNNTLIENSNNIINIENVSIAINKNPIDNVNRNVQIKEKNLLIHLESFNEKQKAEIKKPLQEFIKEKGNGFLKQNVSKYIKILDKYTSKEVEEKNIKILKKVIPKDHYEILCLSIFILKECKDEELFFIKKELRKKYGYLSLSIINLQSSGYFEDYLVPLCEATSGDNVFKDIYHQLVKSNTLTIFVHKGSKIQEELNQKIRKAERFKTCFGFINIHGKGKNNIQIIESFLEKVKHENYLIKAGENRDYIIKKMILEKDLFAIKVVYNLHNFVKYGKPRI